MLKFEANLCMCVNKNNLVATVHFRIFRLSMLLDVTMSTRLASPLSLFLENFVLRSRKQSEKPVVIKHELNLEYYGQDYTVTTDRITL